MDCTKSTGITSIIKMDDNWFEEYKDRLLFRYSTFKKALELLNNRFGKGALIVETGTLRVEDSWKDDGYSTFIFGRYCQMTNSHLITIDNNPINLATSKRITKDYEKYIDYVLSDSIEALEKFNREIHLLYLDSLGWDALEAIEYYKVIECQEHQRRELLAALPKLTEFSIVLLDDNGKDIILPMGGKTQLSKEVLRELGWHELIDSQQSLWVKR